MGVRSKKQAVLCSVYRRAVETNLQMQESEVNEVKSLFPLIR